VLTRAHHLRPTPCSRNSRNEMRPKRGGLRAMSSQPHTRSFRTLRTRCACYAAEPWRMASRTPPNRALQPTIGVGRRATPASLSRLQLNAGTLGSRGYRRNLGRGAGRDGDRRRQSRFGAGATCRVDAPSPYAICSSALVTRPRRCRDASTSRNSRLRTRRHRRRRYGKHGRVDGWS